MIPSHTRFLKATYFCVSRKLYSLRRHSVSESLTVSHWSVYLACGLGPGWLAKTALVATDSCLPQATVVADMNNADLQKISNILCSVKRYNVCKITKKSRHEPTIHRTRRLTDMLFLSINLLHIYNTDFAEHIYR